MSLSGIQTARIMPAAAATSKSIGFNTPKVAPYAKAAEAAQSAYYDPNRPQCAYVPPPAYYESPPSFQQATEKKDQ